PRDHAPEGRLGDRVAESPATLADGSGRLDLSRARGDVDDDAGALLLPEGQAELDELEGGVHVAAEHALDELQWRGLGGVPWPQADVAPVVDQHVDAAEPRDGGLD